MIEVGLRDTGYQIVVSGALEPGELLTFPTELSDELAGLPSGFPLVLDIRALASIDAENLIHLEEALEAAQKLGMQKLAVLAISSSYASPMFQMSNRLRLGRNYLYIDTPAAPDWRTELDDWLQLPTPS